MTLKRPLRVTGGAGYIGSHAVLAFREAGYPAVVLDDLSTGLRSAVSPGVVFVEGDAGDAGTVGAVIAEHGIAAVVHFAGSVVVTESVANPLKYYRNNSAASTNLIRACIDGGVTRFVFSSTPAVYGIPAVTRVSEDAPAVPINPYGSSKLATEWALRDTAAAHDFRYAALRYFNVAGADSEGRAGQCTRNATHLVKVASKAAVGLRDGVTVFGADYDTPEGTCVRDYIHVSDLPAGSAGLRSVPAAGRFAICVARCDFARALGAFRSGGRGTGSSWPSALTDLGPSTQTGDRCEDGSRRRRQSPVRQGRSQHDSTHSDSRREALRGHRRGAGH